ncbi:MAG: sugar transferase [Lachnospiraceae bacterium]|nr:sugar transferase [Lachnospiraceae bacterium]
MRQLEEFKKLILLGFAAVGLVLQIAIYRYFYYEYFMYPIKLFLPLWNKGHILLILIYAALLVMMNKMYGGMKIGYYRNAEVIFSEIFALLIVNVITYFQNSVMSLHLLAVEQFAVMTVLQASSAALWTVVATFIYKNIFPPRRLLVVHGERPVDDILRKFASRKDKYIIEKCMNISEGIEAVCAESLNEYNAVVIWDIDVTTRNEIMKFCYGKNIRVYIMPHISDVILKGSDMLNLFDTPIFLTREYVLTMDQRFFKRMIDLVCAIILAVVTSPIMLITAIVVKAYDGGPVLYKQVRVTRDDKEFKIMKFRSMRVDAEKDGVARLAAKNDDRITPIGKFIRKVRIDELPQLFNIIKGDMSFIGPRPERPEIIKQYLEEMPEFAFRTKVKAGLAGYAQVYGKYNTTPYDKLKLDLTYIENYSLWMDIKLMLLTLKILFSSESTEGVDEKQVTALKNGKEQK